LTQTQAVEQYVRGITRNVQKFKRFWQKRRQIGNTYIPTRHHLTCKAK
jgi:hypothetical protein